MFVEEMSSAAVNLNMGADGRLAHYHASTF